MHNMRMPITYVNINIIFVIVLCHPWNGEWRMDYIQSNPILNKMEWCVEFFWDLRRLLMDLIYLPFGNFYIHIHIFMYLCEWVGKGVLAWHLGILISFVIAPAMEDKYLIALFIWQLNVERNKKNTCSS
jgi:hypothetical protein